MEALTDRQLDALIQMISMVLDGCSDLEEAKRKINTLKDQKDRAGE